MRRTILAAAGALLLAGPTILAFASGGFFAEPRLIAAIVAWATVGVAALLAPQPLPTSRPGRLALAGLVAFTAWSALSIAWAPLAGPAFEDVQRLVLYVAALVAAAALLRPRATARAIEPGLALGVTVVMLYGLGERLLPGIVELSRTATGGGRLDQPLTYWNAEGVLGGIGPGRPAAGAGARARARRRDRARRGGPLHRDRGARARRPTLPLDDGRREPPAVVRQQPLRLLARRASLVRAPPAARCGHRRVPRGVAARAPVPRPGTGRALAVPGDGDRTGRGGLGAPGPVPRRDRAQRPRGHAARSDGRGRLARRRHRLGRARRRRLGLGDAGGQPDRDPAGWRDDRAGGGAGGGARRRPRQPSSAASASPSSASRLTTRPTAKVVGWKRNATRCVPAGTRTPRKT